VEDFTAAVVVTLPGAILVGVAMVVTGGVVADMAGEVATAAVGTVVVGTDVGGTAVVGMGMAVLPIGGVTHTRMDTDLTDGRRLRRAFEPRSGEL
jgi:putative copper export protein